MVQAPAARLVDFEGGGVESVVEIVVVRAEGLVVERAGDVVFIRCHGPPGHESEYVAALVDDLVVIFVLPRIEQRIGNDVLLLGRDLSDDDVGQADVTSAVVGVWATGLIGGARLVGLLLMRPFEGFSFFYRFFFFFFRRREFFLFLFGSFLRFLLFLGKRFAAGVETAILAVKCGRLVAGAQQWITDASGGPRDHAVENRVAVAGGRAGWGDRRVIAAEAVSRGGVARAVRRAQAFVGADRHARGREQVVDRAHALGEFFA